MQLGDRQQVSDAQLIGSSIFDQQGYLLGQVLNVISRPNGQFALVVQFPAAQNKMDDLIVESHQIAEIDLKNQIIRTDLDFNSVVPTQGRRIQLVEEKLVINRQRHKLGEVVVRKVVETEWVQVPIQREKLVVQKVGEPGAIATVNLDEVHINNVAAQSTSPLNANDMTTQTSSPLAANHVIRPSTEALGSWGSLEAALEALDRLATEQTTTDMAVAATLVMREFAPIRMEFPSTWTAAQMLTTLARDWGQQCQEVRLERL